MDEKISKELKDNLIDAGCQNELIQTCMDCIKVNNIDMLDFHLQKHRQYLLDCLHKYQNEIDCLDYLRFQIEKEGGI